ncbi:MAG TPA: hypothetical protein DCY88_16365 [Cyanobacteria bacterium UBA11372]|nr:hypothetical protein [Cyanobacteria bacterium UBA11372]
MQSRIVKRFPRSRESYRYSDQNEDISQAGNFGSLSLKQQNPISLPKFFSRSLASLCAISEAQFPLHQSRSVDARSMLVKNRVKKYQEMQT